MRMGLPRLLTTDQGSEFKNEMDKQMIKLLGIKRIFTTPYHPQVSLKYDSYNFIIVINYVGLCFTDLYYYYK